MSPLKHIAVIGAGLAGLACAQRLQASGYRVTVFEKSRGAAGRMSTKRGDAQSTDQACASSWQCDTGAQYFTARDPAFQAEVQRWQAAGVAVEWQPRLRVFGDTPSVASINDKSPSARYVGTPRMTAPARHLAESLNLRTQTTVQALRRDASGWALRSAEHDWLPERYAAVLLAVPAPQALPLLHSIADDRANTFADIASSAHMRASWALMLRYREPLTLSFDAAFVNHGPLRWVAHDSHKPGRSGQDCWLLHASAAWSEAHINDSAEAIASRLIAAFSELGAPAPDAWTAHRWRYADTEPALQHGALWQPDIGLGLCGDWLNGGKVEGAWLSGQQLAQRILSPALAVT